MAGSTMGRYFAVTNFGESHGPAVGCVIDGCPAGMPLSAADIQKELDRRKPGTSRFVTQRREADEVEILSGLYEGVTTGTPIALLIRNTNQKSRDYSAIADKYRPSHADFAYERKYGLRDPRGGGRSSARLTAPTVAAGAVARKWLSDTFGIVVRARISAIGHVQVPLTDWNETANNPFFAADAASVPELEALLESVRMGCNSVGACVDVEARGVPAGWGDPLYARLDGLLAGALMGLNAVKGVEIGAGFGVVAGRGTELADQMGEGFRFLTNHSGGIQGGISNGEPITARVAIKPTPSVASDLKTCNARGEEVTLSTHGRHDPCVGIRAVPVVEALVSLVLIDCALSQRAQRGGF